MAKALCILTGELVELPLPVFNQIYVPVPEYVETSDSADTKTEQGYVPPEQQIEDMRRAGLLLDAARRGRFDSSLYDESGDMDIDIALDPYRELGADIVDLARVALENGRRLRLQDADAKKARAEAEAAARAKAVTELSASLEGKTAQEIDALLKASNLTSTQT